jgi:hypothetical protein
MPNTVCPENDLQVNTWGGFEPSVVNTVVFHVVVP